MGVSDTARQAIDELLDAGEVHMIPCSELLYVFDAKGLGHLKIAKSVRQYKELHWLPVRFVPADKEIDVE